VSKKQLTGGTQQMFSWLLLPAFVGSILKILATAFEIVSPLLKGIFEALVEYFKILWEGLKDILDSWKTIVTVISMLLALFVYDRTASIVREHQVQKQIESLKKQIPSRKPMPQTQYPFDWLFR
jgi:hypothetical protein